jgi:alpha-galactosidase
LASRCAPPFLEIRTRVSLLLLEMLTARGAQAVRKRYNRWVGAIALAALVLALAGLLYAPVQRATRPALALENGLARTPPMGWNSWNHFGCAIDEQIVRETADALVATGLRDAGYQYLVIDDCWQTGRGRDGLIHASTRTFPSGIGALATYAHERGLKLGIYTDAGTRTCQGRPGSLGYEYQDAATYAAWGVDFVKIDWCFTEGLDARAQYAVWRDAIAASGRPMLISISEWGVNAPWEWAGDTGNMWRSTDDITPEWSSILRNLDQTAWNGAAAGPGRWHDPDMLEVGNGSLTLEEQKAHFSMWALLAAPLIAGNDVRAMSPEVGSILANGEIIAVDQDAAGVPGTIVDDTGAGQQVWMKQLADGGRAVVLLNRGEQPATITAMWEKLGLPPEAAVSVRDLWEHRDLGVFTGSFSAPTPPHGATVVRLSPAQGMLPEPAQPTQPSGWLSERPWLEAASGHGPPEIDRSNGEENAGDGGPLSLRGAAYERGLGVHAPSRLAYELGGGCTSFSADVGVDDETGGNGSVSFEVWTDGALAWTSGVLSGTSPAEHVTLDMRGVHELRLVVTDGGDGVEYDHADWAGAALGCG